MSGEKTGELYSLSPTFSQEEMRNSDKTSDIFDETSLTKMNGSSQSNETPMMREDAGGTGGGHNHNPPDDPSTPGKYVPTYLNYISDTITFGKWEKELAIHSGVPTWKETVDASQANEPNVIEEGNGRYVKLHFGDIYRNTEDRESDISHLYDWYFIPEG